MSLDMITLRSGEVLSLCGNLNGPWYRARLTFYPCPESSRIGLGSLLLRRAAEIAFERYAPLTMRFDGWVANQALAKAAARAGFRRNRVFDDPAKRPPGVQSVEYVLDCTDMARKRS